MSYNHQYPHSIPGTPYPINSNNVFHTATSCTAPRHLVCNLCGCPLCYLPTLDDFKILSLDMSSRISTVTKCITGPWKFENYRRQVFYRSLDNPPFWYISYPWGNTLLCNHQADVLEKVYGQFCYPDSAPDREWILKGYRWIEESPYIFSICFSMTYYLYDLGNCRHHNTTSGAISTPGPQTVITGQQARPSLPAAFPSTDEVLLELQNWFRKKYNDVQVWSSRCPLKLNFREIPIYSIFDLTIRSQETCSSGNETSELSIFQPFDVTINRILLRGGPGFGKSFLTSILGHQWSHDFSAINQFKLCILCDLLRLSFEIDVTKELVNGCYFKNSAYSSDLVGRTLAENSEKILLIFDNYDLLPEDHQHKLQIFLETSDVFCKSTVIIATRSTVDDNFLKKFHKLIDIRGFTKNYFRKYLRLDQSENECVKFFIENVSEIQLFYLSTLSPYFNWFAYLAMRSNLYNYRNCRSLYPLFDYMIQEIIFQKHSSSSATVETCEMLLYKLGEIFFYSLVKRKEFFTLMMLRKAFGDNYALLVEWNVLYRQEQSGNLWFASSKILKVFFATRYLRNKWSEMENDDQRRKFLRSIFCFDACEGDYIQGEDCLYYVGLIPEIVLKFTRDSSLQSANFEMYYDVERVEHSTAFDSVNLLSRVSDNHLNRFGFREIPKDRERSSRIFEGISDIASDPNCKAEFFFYVNTYENKHFLVIDVQIDVGTSVLQAILREDNDQVIDRVCIDFVYHQLENMFDCVRYLLTRFLKGFDLPDDVMSMPPMCFVYNLFCLICSVIDKRVATVICGSTASGSLKALASFKVCWNRETHEPVICFTDQNFKCSQFKKDDFFNKDPSEILPELNDIAERDLVVSINLS